MRIVWLAPLGVIAALAAGAALAMQPPPPPAPPPPPPPPPGFDPAYTADFQTLLVEMTRAYYPLQLAPTSPFYPPGRTPGMSLEAWQCAEYVGRSRAVMIEVAGEVTGPGGLRHALRTTASSVDPPTSGRPEGGVLTMMLARATEGGAVALLFGVRQGGASHIGEVSGLRSGAPFTLQLGGGFAFRGTATVRERTPVETASATRLNDMILASARRVRDVPRCEGEAAPGAVIYQSPLTNAVIREGDGRGVGVE